MSVDTIKPQSSKRADWAGWLLLAGALYLLIALLFPAISCRPENPKRAEARRDAGQLATALKQYQIEYASLPTGGDAQILATLRGDNPKKIVFFECQPEFVNANGELIDPWKSPYRIDTADAAHLKVYSCGQDRQDNGGAAGSDDISNNFTITPTP